MSGLGSRGRMEPVSATTGTPAKRYCSIGLWFSSDKAKEDKMKTALRLTIATFGAENMKSAIRFALATILIGLGLRLQAATTIQFASASYTVAENAGAVTLMV